MFRRMTTRTRILALAGLGLFYVVGPADAQQGWPIAGANWDLYGGGGGQGRSSWSSSGSYSPSYSSSSYYTRYPSSSGNYSGSYYAAYPSSLGTDESSKTHAAVVNLRVPSDARIWFDQSQTKQTGTMRSFESPPLDVGSEYSYQVRIQWKRDGKDVTETRHVTLHAGDVINLTLGSPQVAVAR
jgi:uncharacterized protein (TIGR03000 family)